MILLLSVATGMIFIITKTLNMLLSKEVGIYKSNIVNHVTGTIGALLFVLLFLRNSDFQLVDLTRIGIYPLLGGILGATFVALSNYTFSKTKVLISTVLILIGQTIASVVIDYYTLGQMVSIQTLIGTMMIIIAVIMYSTPSAKKS
ncbi:MAG: DMT family transporter [Clostridiales bacterium]|nr:DMT family transporter [Clostridiales bacterium]